MKRILFITVFTALILLSGSLIAQNIKESPKDDYWFGGENSIYYNGGDVGIGTNKTAKLLHLYRQENVSLRLERPLGMMYEQSIWDIENSGSIFFKNGTGKLAPETKFTFSQNGTLTATKFIGDGSGLTNLSSVWNVNGDNIYRNTGNVGIGTSTPVYKFEVIQNSSDWASYIYNSNGSGKGLRVQSGYQSVSDATILQLEDVQSNVRLKVLSNGNVGIGTTNPSSKLTVNGTLTATEFIGDGSGLTNLPASSAFWSNTGDDIYYNNGNVGIGTDNPEEMLHVYKHYEESPDYKAPAIRLEQNNEGSNIPMPLLASEIQLASYGFTLKTFTVEEEGEIIAELNSGHSIFNSSLTLRDDNNISRFSCFFNNGVTHFFVRDENGNDQFLVNTGYATFYDELRVMENVRFNQKLWVKEEVVIQETCPFPDYVFKKDYELMSLPELKQYIAKHNKLPEVPSAEEVAENGLNVGEMNVTLLKKIEELTLYTLEQQELIEELRKEVDNLKEKE